MYFKRTISIRTLLYLVTIFGIVLALDRFVESKTSNFIASVQQHKQEIDVELDGKTHQVPNVRLFETAEKTTWYDRMMLRRQYELQYAGSFVSGQHVTVRRTQCFVVYLFGSPREKHSFDLAMFN